MLKWNFIGDRIVRGIFLPYEYVNQSIFNQPVSDTLTELGSHKVRPCIRTLEQRSPNCGRGGQNRSKRRTRQPTTQGAIDPMIERRFRRRCRRNERTPRRLRRGRDGQRVLRRRRAVEDHVAARQEVVRQRRVLPADHHRPRHRPVQIVAEHELAQEYQRLRGLPHRHEVARALEEDVREAALLVHDTGEVPVVVEPRRRGLVREALLSPERHVLDDDLRAAVLHERVVVPRVEDDGDVRGGGVCRELGEEGDRLYGRVAVLVAAGTVVDGAKGVVEVPDSVLGRRRVERRADGVVVEEGGSVLERLGACRVRDVVLVEVAVCYVISRQRLFFRWSGANGDSHQGNVKFTA